MNDFDKKISTAVENNDLNTLKQMRDELFIEDGESSTPFSAAITLSERGQDILAKEMQVQVRGIGGQGLRSIALSAANRIAKAERRIRFNLKTLFGFKGVKIFSEGDSWFQYPLLLKDIIDHLEGDDDKAILSFGEAGDLLSNMASRQEWAGDIVKHSPEVFLLSGGGNDAFDVPIFENLLKPYEEGDDVDAIIIEPTYTNLLDQLEADYRHMLDIIIEQQPSIGIFGHAYDAPHPQETGPWIGVPLGKRGIPDALGIKIVDRIFADYADILRGIDNDYANYTFVDLRGIVGTNPNSWHDEIHPKSAGFGRIADVFREAIALHLNKSSQTLKAPTRQVEATQATAIRKDMAEQMIAMAASLLGEQDLREMPPLETFARGAGAGGKKNQVTKRILNCLSSEDIKDDWRADDAREADILRAARYPDRFDLREDWWKINDQLSTGSCVGWATADSILRWHFVKLGRINENTMLSSRFIWMAAKETDALKDTPTSFIEEAGTSLKAALDVARKLGCVTDDILPFSSRYPYTGTENSFFARATRLKINNYHNLGVNPHDWRSWIYQNGPILAHISVDEAFQNASHTQGRLTQHDPSSQSGHAVAIVGYTSEGFIIRNSWGTDWGDRGFALATHAYAESAIKETYGVQVY